MLQLSFFVLFLCLSFLQIALLDFFCFFFSAESMVGKLVNNCARVEMTHWYTINMPFLLHFSEKSPPRCIKFRACSKRCNFSRIEIALTLQVVYMRYFNFLGGRDKDCTENRDKILSKIAGVNGPLICLIKPGFHMIAYDHQIAGITEA